MGCENTMNVKPPNFRGSLVTENISTAILPFCPLSETYHIDFLRLSVCGNISKPILGYERTREHID